MYIHIHRIEHDQVSVKLEDFSKEDVGKLRAVGGGKWDPNGKFWRFPCTEEKIRQFAECFPGAEIRMDGLAVSLKLSSDEKFIQALEQKLLISLKLKGYSLKTSKAYRGHVRRYLQNLADHLKMKSPGTLKDEKMTSAIIDSSRTQQYALQLLEQGHSPAYVNQAISALRFLAVEVFKQPSEPQKEKKLPYVLSEQEVLRVIQAPTNLKHRTMLYLAYASGLRVSEVVPAESHGYRPRTRHPSSPARKRQKGQAYLTIANGLGHDPKIRRSGATLQLDVVVSGAAFGEPLA